MSDDEDGVVVAELSEKDVDEDDPINDALSELSTESPLYKPKRQVKFETPDTDSNDEVPPERPAPPTPFSGQTALNQAKLFEAQAKLEMTRDQIQRHRMKEAQAAADRIAQQAADRAPPPSPLEPSEMDKLRLRKYQQYLKFRDVMKCQGSGRRITSATKYTDLCAEVMLMSEEANMRRANRVTRNIVDNAFKLAEHASVNTPIRRVFDLHGLMLEWEKEKRENADEVEDLMTHLEIEYGHLFAPTPDKAMAQLFISLCWRVHQRNRGEAVASARPSPQQPVPKQAPHAQQQPTTPKPQQTFARFDALRSQTVTARPDLPSF